MITFTLKAVRSVVLLILARNAELLDYISTVFVISLNYKNSLLFAIWHHYCYDVIASYAPENKKLRC